MSEEQELNPYEVSLPAFEGPLDLLLHLIKKHEIDIYDIPIVEITHQYTDYLNMMRDLNLNIAADFLVMAATLIHIKARMMLPNEKDETGEETDPRQELVEQLIEHQLFKELAGTLDQMQLVRQTTFARGKAFQADSAFNSEPTLEAGLSELLSSYVSILERKSKDSGIEFELIRVTLSQQISFLLKELNLFKSLTFDEIFSKFEERISWIVGFLALLELIRLQFVKVTQDHLFGSIRLVRTFEHMNDDEIKAICNQFGE